MQVGFAMDPAPTCGLNYKPIAHAVLTAHAFVARCDGGLEEPTALRGTRPQPTASLGWALAALVGASLILDTRAAAASGNVARSE